MTRWTSSHDESLQKAVASCYANPEKYVDLVYPWGKGILRDRTIRPWQRDYLRDLGQQIQQRGFNGVDPVPPIRFSTVSGHGPGKTALTAWLAGFYHDTRPFSKGTMTANTGTQLQSRTWSELAKWHSMSLTRHWSDIRSSKNNMALLNKMHPETWFVKAFTARKENSEAFQGQHAEGSTSFYIFDEASSIPKQIYEAAYGGLVGGEPHFHEFGNGTQSSGEFYWHHHRDRDKWTTRRISSLEVVGLTELYEEWIESYGRDSDFVKVRILGEFPGKGALQFIPTEWVDRCMEMEPIVLPSDPLIFGVDIARHGGDRTVLFPRRGRCAIGQPEEIEIIPDEDSTNVAGRIVERNKTEQPDAIFIDGGAVGGPIIDMVRNLGCSAIEVNSAYKSPDPRCANMRAYMWQKMKEAIKAGVALPKNDDLRDDLVGLEFGYRITDNAILLERKEDAKKRGLASPDMGDALAFTYSFAVPHRSDGKKNYWAQPKSLKGAPNNLVNDHFDY